MRVLARSPLMMWLMSALSAADRVPGHGKVSADSTGLGIAGRGPRWCGSWRTRRHHGTDREWARPGVVLETLMAISRSYQSIGDCQHCGGTLPPSATTGRRRVYCSDACRKGGLRDAQGEEARREDREARRPVVVETHETIVAKGHDVGSCMVQVAQSPRACANLVGHLAGMTRNGDLLDANEWAPVVRAINDLNKAILDRSGPARGRYR